MSYKIENDIYKVLKSLDNYECYNKYEYKSKILNDINNCDKLNFKNINKNFNKKIYLNLSCKKKRNILKIKNKNNYKIKELIKYELKEEKYNFSDFFYKWFELYHNFSKFENINNKYFKKFIYRLFIKKRIGILLTHFNHNGKFNYDNQILKKEFEIKFCAEFISYITNITLGNVWLINNKYNNKIVYSKFKKFNHIYKDKLENIFSSINYNHNDNNNNLNINELINQPEYHLTSNEYKDIKKYLKIGNLVGLYYYKTTFHSVSLYESGIGGKIFDTTENIPLENYLDVILKNFNNEKIIRDNKIKNINKCITKNNKFIISSYFIKKHEPLFVNSENNKPWNKNMIGKNIKFKFKDDTSVEKLNFNTHIGIVADIVDGEPVILHNIEGHLIYHKFKYLIYNCNIVWISEFNDTIIDNNLNNMIKFLNKNYNNNSISLLNEEKINNKKVYYKMKNNKPYVLINEELRKCSYPKRGCFLKENEQLKSKNKYYCFYNDFNSADCVSNLEYSKNYKKKKLIENFNNKSKYKLFNIIVLIIIIIILFKTF